MTQNSLVKSKKKIKCLLHLSCSSNLIYCYWKSLNIEIFQKLSLNFVEDEPRSENFKKIENKDNLQELDAAENYKYIVIKK